MDWSTLTPANAAEAGQLADLQRAIGDGTPLRDSLQKFGVLVAAPSFNVAAADVGVPIAFTPTDLVYDPSTFTGPQVADSTNTVAGTAFDSLTTASSPTQDLVGFIATVAGILITLAGAVLACNSAPPFSEGVCVLLAVTAAIAFLVAAVVAFAGVVLRLIDGVKALANRIAYNVQRYADDSTARAKAYIANLRGRIQNVVFGCAIIACPS